MGRYLQIPAWYIRFMAEYRVNLLNVELHVQYILYLYIDFQFFSKSCKQYIKYNLILSKH